MRGGGRAPQKLLRKARIHWRLRRRTRHPDRGRSGRRAEVYLEPRRQLRRVGSTERQAVLEVPRAGRIARGREEVRFLVGDVRDHDQRTPALHAEAALAELRVVAEGHVELRVWRELLVRSPRQPGVRELTRRDHLVQVSQRQRRVESFPERGESRRAFPLEYRNRVEEGSHVFLGGNAWSGRDFIRQVMRQRQLCNQ